MKRTDPQHLLMCSLKAGFYLLLFLAMQVAATIVYMILAVLFGGMSPTDLLESESLLAITIFSDAFVLFAIVLIATLKDKDPLGSLAIRKFDLRLIAPISICAVSVCFFMCHHLCYRSYYQAVMHGSIIIYCEQR